MRKSTWAVALSALVTTSCTLDESLPNDSPERTIQAYIAASNVRDFEAMRALLHPDIEWTEIGGSDSVLYARGPSMLTTELDAYYSNPAPLQIFLSDWDKNERPFCVKEQPSSLETTLCDDPVTVIHVRETFDASGETKGDDVLHRTTAYHITKEHMIRRIFHYPNEIVPREQ